MKKNEKKMKKDKKMKKNEKAPKTIPKIWLRNGEYQNSWNYPFHTFFSASGIYHSAQKKRNGTARSVVKKVSWKSPFLVGGWVPEGVIFHS